MQGNSINRKKKPTNPQKETFNKKLNVKEEANKFKPTSLISKTDKKNRILYISIQILVTFGVYFITFQNNYTNWDDGKYVDENPLIKPLDGETVKQMFTSDNLSHRYWMGNYHPLTMLTLNVNYALAEKDEEGKAKPFGFQLVNIILHIINTLLVFFILFKLVKDEKLAFFAALLFGIHTMHVESVSWIAERKDVLYTAFFLTSLYIYTLYAEQKKITLYIISFLLFVLSLLSKGQAVSLSVTLLLIDYFYDRKLLSLKVILEKLPFIILAAVFGLIAIEAQKAGNAIQEINTTPIISRIGVAAWGFMMYILKLILPVRLSAIYPYTDLVNQTIPAYFWTGFIVVAVAVYAAIKTFKTDKIIFISIGFFVVNIFLLLQLIPVGSAVYADRYAYIPSIGFYLLFVYLLSKIKKIDIKITQAMFVLYIALLSVLTIYRIQVWKDSRTLWEDVIEKQPGAVVALNNLGSVYNQISSDYKDDYDYENFKIYNQKSIVCFDRAIELKPDYTSAFYNRGYAKRLMGFEFNDTAYVYAAIEDFNKAISTDLTFVRAYQERGSCYDWLRNFEMAINDYNMALNYEPKNHEIFINRGISKGKTGDFESAIEDFNRAIQLHPENSTAYSNRGLAYAFLKDYEAAIKDYTLSLQLEESENTYYNRGLAYYNTNEPQKAIADFNKAIELKFKSYDVYYYLGMSYLQLEQTDEACKYFKIGAENNYSPAVQAYNYYCSVTGNE